MTLDDRILALIGGAMPLGLSSAEILVACMDDDGDLEAALARLSQETPPRIKLVDSRWKLCVAPVMKGRSPLLGSGRDPGAALGFGGGPAMVVSSSPRRRP